MTTAPQRDLVERVMRLPPDVRRRLAAMRIPYCPHVPTPRQAAFLALTTREAFYGGAAGGGKSDALLMGALQYVGYPGYAALILRKSYADLALPDAIMDRAAQWLGGVREVRSLDGGKRYAFPSGAVLQFGYLEHPKDRYRYQSSAFHYIAFDEVTQFAEQEYRYLFSRLRRLRGSPVPPRMRCAGNPDGIGFAWIKARFVAEPSPRRPFIPARMEDNPYLDRADYELSLAELDPVTRRRLRDGDWSAHGGGSYFARSWFRIEDRRPPHGRAVRYWDLAATEPRPGTDPDYTVGVLLREWGGTYWVEDITRGRWRPGVVEERVREAALADGPEVTVWIEEEPGASGKSLMAHYRRTVLPDRAVRGMRHTGTKQARIKIVSSRAEAGAIRLVAGPWIGAFLDEAEAFPDVAHDDQLDALSGAYLALQRTVVGEGEQEDERRAATSEPLSHLRRTL